ncbi:epoxide hydrolase N-terminal domain-containing protein [Nocardia sp. NPDC005998]|uniref:epoxide hydrolase N-terminal domain-containing protein n=1 Tax=Nocardia sp. NPDC005998 TaxID=3156894 RepID=UPI00339FBDA9
MTEIEPFPISIPDPDLQERLDRVRLPEAETVPDGSQGIGLERLRNLLDAWRQHDWRSVEK